jgi:hypothetical protein
LYDSILLSVIPNPKMMRDTKWNTGGIFEKTPSQKTKSPNRIDRGFVLYLNVLLIGCHPSTPSPDRLGAQGDKR